MLMNRFSHGSWKLKFDEVFCLFVVCMRRTLNFSQLFRSMILIEEKKNAKQRTTQQNT